MINTYTYIETPQSKLHMFVIAFFNRIEFEIGEFSTDFYDKEFYENLVSHHKTTLGGAFFKIYSITRNWNQESRTFFCDAIRKSNEIKTICEGAITPWKTDDIPVEIRELAKTLFKKLYEDVLKGDYFTDKYGTRKQHYHVFKKHQNNDYEFCPVCGIVPMHTYLDDITDQYDHYLPKDIYPFSSVNFKNLVPICCDCNSFQTKSSKDILSFTGKVFYPFDEQHKGINIELKITKNNLDDLSNIEWEIIYSSNDGKNNEVQAWKQIYNIDRRHKTHISGNISKWYVHYWNDYKDKDTIVEIPDENQRTNNYLRKLKNRYILEHKCLSSLIDSFEENAKIQGEQYSRYY